MTCSRVAASQLQLLRGTAAQINAVGFKERQHAAADVTDERRLHRGGAERVDSQYLERVAPAGQSDIEFQHGACHTHRGVLRQPCKQLFGEALTRTAHDHIRFADQPFRGEAEFVERGAVHQIHGCAQGDAERDGEHRDQQSRRLFP